ncbi:MAG: penicillin-binding transpeptidase domain-containing protein, partial [Rubrivivax sp.]
AHEARQPWRGPEDQETLPDDEADAERAAAQALKDHIDDEDLRLAVVLAASAKQLRVQLASGEQVNIEGAGLRIAAPGLRSGAPQRLALRRGSVIRVMLQADKRWAVVQWPQADAAFVALDPASGHVRALVGGFDFGRNQFNHVTQAWRQPGSAFKPFIYSAAIEAGVAPDTTVDDLPWTGDSNWQPQNSDGRFDGPMTVREALALSKNLVSIRLLNHTGVTATRNWVARFGFDAERQPANLTLALGAGSTTPLQLAGAYAVLANGGHRVAPVVIERISDAQGHVLYQAPPPELQRVVPERNVFVVDSLLAEVTRSGTAARAQATLQRPDLYGKTGTTNDAVDAWFAGFQPGVVAVAWMGHDQPRSLGEGESGGGLALPIWIASMSQMLRGVPVADPQPPPGLVLVNGDWRYEEWAEAPPVSHIGDGGSGNNR